MKRAIIIDDIENARIGLRQDLLDYCENVEVVGEADGVVSGARLIRETKPDIVFLDIQMRDGSGFDLLEIIGNIDFALIFTTSSDAFAIRAFRFAAVDYLLKPIDYQELQQAVAKTDKTSSAKLDLLRTNLAGGSKRLSLNSQEKIEIVALEDIVRLESSGSYTLFHMKGKEEILVTKTLKEYDEILSAEGFLRVHQSHLVNLAYIKSLMKTDGNYLVLKNGQEVPVSSRKRSDVMRMLGVGS
jgi:two-component system LytT family response regulator